MRFNVLNFIYKVELVKPYHTQTNMYTERMIPMKRILALLLTMVMTLTLAACGSSTPAEASRSTTKPTTEATAAPTDGPRLVTNVDEFLAAIAPDTEILLAEGDFLLNGAKNCGVSDSPYYTWEGWGSGEYALVIQNVTNLTIRGCGQGKTNILTDHISMDVLRFRDCQNVTLESMSLGHTVRKEYCEGAVLVTDNARDMHFADLDLYGCGSVGLQVYGSQNVTLQDSVIHDCSSSGVYINQSTEVTVQSTTFRSMGRETPAFSLFGFFNAGNVTISNCDFSNNYVEYLIELSELDGDEVKTSDLPITFRNNQITGNRLSSAMFSLEAQKLILDGNVFDENECRNWYAGNSAHAVDLEGSEIVFEETSAPAAAAPGTASPVSTGEQKQVHVSTPDEFLAALDNDTCIILDTELLDLSAASEYAAADKALKYPNDTCQGATGRYYWENRYDGPSLVISDLHNLTIMAEGGDRKAHTISATPRYAYVLTFENCSAITISGFTAGHTKEPGQCAGGVVYFRNSEDLLVDNCGLFGCGTIGVFAEASRNLQVVNSEIYECSQSGISLWDCDTVAISGTLIRDIGSEWNPEGPFYEFQTSSNVTLDGAPLDGNYNGR